jgi:hypothetical protein
MSPKEQVWKRPALFGVVAMMLLSAWTAGMAMFGASNRVGSESSAKFLTGSWEPR